MYRAAIAVLASLLLCACQTTAYQSEATSLGNAASALSSALPTKAEIQNAANAAQVTALTELVLNNGAIAYNLDCLSKAQAFRSEVVNSANKPGSDQDDTYTTGLAKLAACSNQTLALDAATPPAPLTYNLDCTVAPQAANIPGAAQATGTPPKNPNKRRGRLAAPPQPSAGQTEGESPAAPIKTADEAWKENSLSERCAAFQQALQSAQTAPAAGSGVSVVTPPSAGESSSKTDLDAYSSAIATYAADVKAITTSTSLDDVNTSLSNANTALDNLVKAADPSLSVTPVTSLLAGLAKLGIQEAQFQALQIAANRFNEAWIKVAPAVKAAARLRYAEIIEDKASANWAAAFAASIFLNRTTSYGSSVNRLWLYNSLEPPVDRTAADLTSSLVDPGKALDAFTNANAHLVDAFKDPKRAAAAALAASQAIDSLAGALTPATASSSKSKAAAK